MKSCSRLIFPMVVSLCLLEAQPAFTADLLAGASAHVGQHERINRKSLRRLLGVDPVAVKWCGAFLAAVTKKAGKRPPSSPNIARSWTRFGKAVRLSQLRRGDVLVMASHVTVYSRKRNGKLCGVGGNQSNRVQESCYPARRVIAVRRP